MTTPDRPSLTPPAFPSALAQPAHAAGAGIPPSPVDTAHLPVPTRKGRSASIWLLGALVLVLVVLVSYFLDVIGIGASLLGLAIALVPFAIVVATVRIIDRWEPEPTSLVILALAWGALAAVAITLGIDLLLNMAFGVDPVRDVLRTVVQAPLVEETAKGIGLFLIFLTARRAFDGPVDGVVYGALIGAGFALTENIQYFALSFIEGGAGDLTVTFFVRGILSPFAHAMFTAIMGFALGLAARRGYTAGRAFRWLLVGYVGAVALHAFWNTSATFFDFFGLYVVLQVPLFIGYILGILALRREEARLTRARLGDYAAAGWFTPEEVDMLATPAGRRAGLAWARGLRGDRTDTMKAFIADATALAAARQRAISGRDAHAAEDERAYLARTAAARRALLAL